MTRFTALTTLAFAITVVGSTIGAVVPAGARTTASDTTLQNVWSADDTAYAADAYERFAQAGLTVPSVEIEFATDADQRSTCDGNGGVYFPSRQLIRICWARDTTLVHELAHAMLETNLPQETKAELLELRGLDHWVDGDSWDENGAEHAAEILTWGLLERDMTLAWTEINDDGAETLTRRLFKIDHSTPTELAEGFRLLTGQEPTARADSLGTAAEDATATTPALSPEATRR